MLKSFFLSPRLKTPSWYVSTITNAKKYRHYDAYQLCDLLLSPKEEHIKYKYVTISCVTCTAHIKPTPDHSSLPHCALPTS